MNVVQSSVDLPPVQNLLALETATQSIELIHNQPVIITGMHKSGTSLTASVLQAAGVHIGNNLMGPGLGNRLGHFEDMDIYALHCNILTSHGIHRDGWTKQPNVAVPQSFDGRIQDFLSIRREQKGLWGWKEPRTTLFLDFWKQALPDAKFVFVYRKPWEVIDSLYRRGDRTFVEHPITAVETWLSYNTAILDFYQRHRADCFLFDVENYRNHEESILHRLSKKLDITLTATSQTKYQPGELQSITEDAKRSDALNHYFPEATRLYEALRATADMPHESYSYAEIDSEMGCYGYLQKWAYTSRTQKEKEITPKEKQQADILFQQLEQHLAASAASVSMHQQIPADSTAV